MKRRSSVLLNYWLVWIVESVFLCLNDIEFTEETWTENPVSLQPHLIMVSGLYSNQTIFHLLHI